MVTRGQFLITRGVQELRFRHTQKTAGKRASMSTRMICKRCNNSIRSGFKTNTI